MLELNIITFVSLCFAFFSTFGMIGECVTLQVRDSEADEIPEIVQRLHAVTNGKGTLELSLRRNAVGQLGFHVQPVR